MPFDPAQLAALAAILRLGSFEAAAEELGITQSAVSQRLRALEERAGTPLVRRGPPASGTDAGLQLARHAEQVALMEAQVLRQIGLSAGGGRVAVAVNADSLATWIIPALALARQEMGETLFDIEVDDQDHSADWLRQGRVSAAITSSAAPVRGCDVLPLGAMRYRATTSPAFMARHFPDGPDENSLRRAPMLIYNAKDTLQSQWLAREFGTAKAPPAHRVPSTQGFADAGRAGLGWGMNPETLIRDALASGELAELRPGRPLDVPLYWQISRLMAPALAPLTRAIRQAALDALIQG